MNKEPKEFSTEFNNGKKKLENGEYEESIQIFSELIEKTEDSLDNKDREVTWNTSLCNRGVSKCQLAIRKKDESLYKEGVADFQTVCDSIKDENEKVRLTAAVLLREANEQLKDFEKITEQTSNEKFKLIWPK